MTCKAHTFLCVPSVWHRFWTDLVDAESISTDGKAVQTVLTIFRRHSRSCPGRSKGREWCKCHCRINLEGYLGEQYIRQSLSMRSCDADQARVRELEGRYYFWSGNGLPKSAVADWQRSLRKLF